jgi:hypothetical protein
MPDRKIVSDYQYEVAISFKAENEPVALQLKAALDPPLGTFVYSKAQEELAGRDGLEAFTEIFRDKCRLVVLLFGAGYGDTRWTRVEETAIKARLFEGDGWPHLLIVRMDKSPLPKWVAIPTKLYFDPATFPVSDLVAAIRARCAELGAQLRRPTAAELARTQTQREEFDQETDRLIMGKGAFQEQYAALCAALESKALEVGEASGRGIVAGEGQWSSFVVFDTRVTLHVTRPIAMPSRLADATVRASLMKGREPTIRELGQGLRTIRGTSPISNQTLRLKRLEGAGWCWEIGRRTLPAADVVDVLLRALLDARQLAMKDDTFLD